MSSRCWRLPIFLSMQQFSSTPCLRVSLPPSLTGRWTDGRDDDRVVKMARNDNGRLLTVVSGEMVILELLVER
jgi:hypothetical protein